MTHIHFFAQTPPPEPGMLFLERRIWGGSQKRLFSILNSKAAKASTGLCLPGDFLSDDEDGVGGDDSWRGAEVEMSGAGQTEQDYHLLNLTPKSLPATKLLCLCLDFHSKLNALSSHPGVSQDRGYGAIRGLWLPSLPRSS